jgi:hypothetical protein
MDRLFADFFDRNIVVLKCFLHHFKLLYHFYQNDVYDESSKASEACRPGEKDKKMEEKATPTACKEACEGQQTSTERLYCN